MGFFIMFIVIDSSIFSALESDTLQHSLDAQSFIAELCVARQKGYVSVIIKKSVAVKIKNNIHLSTRGKAIFGHIAEEVTFQLKLDDITSFNVVFFHSGYSHGINVGDNPYVVDIDGYSTSNVNISKPKLVLEDLSDDYIYKAIARWGLSKLGVPPNFHLSYEPVHGGGDRLPDVCISEMGKGSFVFSICDSDT